LAGHGRPMPDCRRTEHRMAHRRTRAGSTTGLWLRGSGCPANRVEDVNRSAVAETVAFGLDGRHYRLDLSRQDAATLRAALAPFVAVARPGRRGGRNWRRRSRGERVPSSAASSDPNRNAAIREWARQHGHKLSKRGPIPASVLQMYKNDVG
jgi:hypothetical protein